MPFEVYGDFHFLKLFSLCIFLFCFSFCFLLGDGAGWTVMVSVAGVSAGFSAASDDNSVVVVVVVLFPGFFFSLNWVHPSPGLFG